MTDLERIKSLSNVELGNNSSGFAATDTNMATNTYDAIASSGIDDDLKQW